MSRIVMKIHLTELSNETKKQITLPIAPQTVMKTFCGSLFTFDAHADSPDTQHVEMDSLDLVFGSKANIWMTGPYAQMPAITESLRCRNSLSMTSWGGHSL
ncbi:hypothetical protein [Streptomyces alanosinicus]|uniref:Uncharacterized protein n=1 Tax=Streptomyces alanosinicus TaxID=68171 RepID=A0A918YTL6_9ACTN|nr:hypothetical protein [Streptomyces alanosinicus]GHE14758.1 hypothetical protein GCM10010339_86930 [Streptomyces alanosinicus]